MAKKSKPKEVGIADYPIWDESQKRCNRCHQVYTAGVFRCPHCGDVEYGLILTAEAQAFVSAGGTISQLIAKIQAEEAALEEKQK